MSIFVTRTSQKLNFAQLQLEQLAQAQASTGWSQYALVDSCREAALFHLASAYVSFLREIADHYCLDARQVHGFADLERLCIEAGIESPERNELASLEQQGSWLSLMRLGYDACWQPGDKPQAASAEQSRSEISVLQVSSGAAAQDDVTPLQCRQWCGELVRLIERLRAGMQEW